MAEEEKPMFKSAEQRASENTFQHLLTFMCGKTFSRHALLSEEEFLKSTPKKLFKLAEIHQKINNPEDDKPQQEQEVYIDQLF